jgi:hypothetical protein
MNSTAAGASRSRTERALKWVGAITAVLSLIFGIQKLVQSISADNAADRRTAELREVGRMQQANGDYAAAWDSFAAALETAESGGALAKLLGRVDARTQELRALQQDLAMAWLRNIRAPQGRTFTEIVARLLPVLDRGVAAASSARKADLLAHVGWAYFLRSREGESELNPQRQYEAALQIDAANPYAHAYLAHWLSWTHQDSVQVRRHFDAALAANRDRSFVRTLQLAALKNRGAAGDAEYVAVVAEMLANAEEAPDDARRFALWTVQRSCTGMDSEEVAGLKVATAGHNLASLYEALIALEPDATRTRTNPAVRETCLAKLRQEQ